MKTQEDYNELHKELEDLKLENYELDQDVRYMTELYEDAEKSCKHNFWKGFVAALFTQAAITGLVVLIQMIIL